MEIGCFSWCPGSRKKKPATKTTEKPALDSKDSAGAVPTTLEYAVDGGKQIVQVLESAATLIPVPYVQDAIRLALKVVEACEDVTAIEQEVQGLQNRVCYLMIVIIDSVTARDDSTEGIHRTAMEIEQELKDLRSNLELISKDLDDIKNQNRWILFFFRDLNKSKIEDCMNRLTTALERFNLSNDLRTADVLQKIQARLDNIQRLTQRVLERVDGLHEKLDKFSTIMSDVEDVKAQRSATAFTRQQMPLKPRIFHGRDDLVAEIAFLLANEKTSRICILGPGGMGKTSLALAVVESPSIQSRFSKENRFWVPCIQATSTSLFVQIIYVSLRVTRDTKNPLEDILYELNTSKKPRLILLDNFETPWNQIDETQKEVNDILRRLVSLSHVSLLVTMRGTFPPTDDIEWQTQNTPPTDREACRRIFHDINPSSKNDPDLDTLLEALGCMPFAVTLMATLGKEGQSSARDLLDEWDQAGTDMLSVSNNPDKSMNRSIELSVESNLMKQNPGALLLLATLSMLPAGTTRKHLSWWAPTLKLRSQSAAIATLSKAALLMVNEGDTPTLFVLPVVQSYMHLNSRIPDDVKHHVRKACCKYVLDHASRSGDAKFKDDSAALAAEDTNIQSVLFTWNPEGTKTSHSKSSSLVTDILPSLLAFTWYRNDTRPSVDLALHTLKIARSSGHTASIAESLFCLGSTHFRLSLYDAAEKYLQEARASFRSLSSDRDAQRRAGDCGLALANTMGFTLRDVSDIRILLSDVRAEFTALSDDYGLGRCFLEMGRAWKLYQDDDDASLANQYIKDGKALLEKLGRMLDVAKCFYELGDALYAAGKYTEALDACMKALKLVEQFDDDYLRGDITQTLGMIFVRLGQYVDALQYAKQSLMTFQYIGNPLGVAQVFELIGQIYLRQGDYQDAHAAYETARDAYAGNTTTMGRRGKDHCERNIAKIMRKLMYPHDDIGFLGLRPDWDCDVLFYSSAAAALEP